MSLQDHSKIEKQLSEAWQKVQNADRQKWFLLGVIAVATTMNHRPLLEKWLPMSKEILGEEAIEETILQTLLFAGFPKTIEALKVLREFFPVSQGSKHVSDHKQAGEETSRIIYGKYHGKLKLVMDELHPDLTRWMIEDGYGRVLSRSGLTIQEREIAVLGSLMASGMIEQYRAHLRGTRYTGVLKVDIIWFTNTFECIIAADLKDDFTELTRKMLESQ